MEIRQLRYFEAVVRHRHFTNAADELQVAQSALSHQVRRLEQELGTELLRRTTRSVAPTQAGELVAARARAVLAETAALRGEIDELRGLTRGHVSVGAMLFGGELDIPTILARFTASYPEVEVRLRDGIAQRFREMLGDGSLDVAFALEAQPPEGVQRLELSSEELVVAMSADHPLAGDGPMSLEALAGSRLIAFQRGSSTRQLIDEALTRPGRAPGRVRGERPGVAAVAGRGRARGGDLPPLIPGATGARGVLSAAGPLAADDGRAVVVERPPAVARRAGVRGLRSRAAGGCARPRPPRARSLATSSAARSSAPAGAGTPPPSPRGRSPRRPGRRP